MKNTHSTQSSDLPDIISQEESVQTQQDYMLETASILRTRGEHAIHCLTVVGQIEGHNIAPQTQKTTKYEHVIPQLVSIEEDPSIEALLVILNTVGGDVEAGLAIAELISGLSKPTATLVLGGGHSIGIPLAVSAKHSFIVPTATMTIHPVRHSGVMLGVPQTMRYFEQMQQRIAGFVSSHSNISIKRFESLMVRTGELVMDMGSVLDGKAAVKEGLIDSIGTISDALKYLYKEIDNAKKPQKAQHSRTTRNKSKPSASSKAQSTSASKPAKTQKAPLKKRNTKTAQSAAQKKAN